MTAAILIVEDNPQSLELMSYLLCAHGHTVHSAGTATRALQAVETYAIDLVLLDLQLPDADGQQVLQVLRVDTRRPPAPIIAVTALAMLGDRERILAASFDHYLPKPINPRTFVEEIDTWLPSRHQAAGPTGGRLRQTTN